MAMRDYYLHAIVMMPARLRYFTIIIHHHSFLIFFAFTS